MRPIIIILTCLLCFGCATTDRWTKSEKAKEVAWLILHAVDYKQTQYAMDRPDEFKELNPLLGNRPSEGRLNTFALAGAILHVLTTDLIDTENRGTWLNITLGMKIVCVGNNFYVGAKVEF